MNKTILTLAALLSVLCLFAGAPEVTAVTASQQENLVVIDYYLAHPDELLCNVSVEISDDGGLSYGIVPSPGSLSGDIGIVEATEQGAPARSYGTTARTASPLAPTTVLRWSPTITSPSSYLPSPMSSQPPICPS